ncbi:MAG: class I SAM-dependent methyltransferase [Candidatus Glassbacteria bacterium]|nr:class I SAM-dependent methyltransferase [Candidatus Glassbacteria bacterium]
MDRETKEPRDLAGREHWKRFWAEAGEMDIRLNPRTRNFSDLHKLFVRCLPGTRGKRFMELGCYPGRFLWYFATHFGCRVSGMEYVESCCRATEKNLARENIQSEIINADLFKYDPGSNESWDIIASFGLVEHFVDGELIIQRHLELVKPGGLVIVTVPNLQGLYGKILKKLDPRTYSVHRVISLEQLTGEALACSECEIVEAGYYGRLGFGHTGLREAARGLGKPVDLTTRALLYAMENTAQYLFKPSSCFSPYIALVARKRPAS